jgi:acetolactate synthase regulatory subunit
MIKLLLDLVLALGVSALTLTAAVKPTEVVKVLVLVSSRGVAVAFRGNWHEESHAVSVKLCMTSSSSRHRLSDQTSNDL